MECTCKRYRIKYLACLCTYANPDRPPRICGKTVTSKGKPAYCLDTQDVIDEVDEVCPRHQQSGAWYDRLRWSCCRCGKRSQLGAKCRNPGCPHACCNLCGIEGADQDRTGHQEGARARRSPWPREGPSGSQDTDTNLVERASMAVAQSARIQEETRNLKSSRWEAARAASKEISRPPSPSRLGSRTANAPAPQLATGSPRAGALASSSSGMIRPVARRIGASNPESSAGFGGPELIAMGLQPIPSDLPPIALPNSAQGRITFTSEPGPARSSPQEGLVSNPSRSRNNPQARTSTSRPEAARNLQECLRSELPIVAFQQQTLPKSDPGPAVVPISLQECLKSGLPIDAFQRDTSSGRPSQDSHHGTGVRLNWGARKRRN